MLLVAGIETARGIAAVEELLSAGIAGAYFGAEDYIADLGGRRTACGNEVLYARSGVALAARLSAVSAIDQAVTNLNDEGRFVADAEQGRDLGFAGKLRIHPSQVALARAIFQPTGRDLDHAR